MPAIFPQARAGTVWLKPEATAGTCSFTMRKPSQSLNSPLYILFLMPGIMSFVMLSFHASCRSYAYARLAQTANRPWPPSKLCANIDSTTARPFHVLRPLPDSRTTELKEQHHCQRTTTPLVMQATSWNMQARRKPRSCLSLSLDLKISFVCSCAGFRRCVGVATKTAG